MATKERQQELDKMDLLIMTDLLAKCPKRLTTTHGDYIDHSKNATKNVLARNTQTDPSLIAGHFVNNLMVNGQHMHTKTWPGAMDWREEYRQYLLRLKWCNEKIYNLFFVCPPVRYQQIEQFLNDLHKTVYLSDYSPNEYVSLISQRRINDRRGNDNQILASKDYQTTYGNYHNRIQDLNDFREVMYPKPKPKDMTLAKFAKEMRKLFKKYDLTTYYEEICVPALMKAKNGIMPSGPIDRYTLRKY